MEYDDEFYLTDDDTIDQIYTEQNFATNSSQMMPDLINDVSRLTLNNNMTKAFSETTPNSERPKVPQTSLLNAGRLPPHMMLKPTLLTHQNSIQETSSNGLIKTNEPLKMLSVEVDPHAWDLKMDDLDFQRIVGNIGEYVRFCRRTTDSACKRSLVQFQSCAHFEKKMFIISKFVLMAE